MSWARKLPTLDSPQVNFDYIKDVPLLSKEASAIREDGRGK